MTAAPPAASYAWHPVAVADTEPRRSTIPGWLPLLPAALLVLPMIASLAAWLAPIDPDGLTGFVQRIPPSPRTILLLAAWSGSLGILAGVAIHRGASGRAFSGLRFIRVESFQATCTVIGAVGTGWVYWKVTGGSLGALLALWRNNEFYRFAEFDYGVGISTGRYAGVVAGGLAIANLVSGRRVGALDLSSLAVLGATVLMVSRLSALMAICIGAAILVFERPRRRIVWRRLGPILAMIIVLFVAANVSRNTNFYQQQGRSGAIETTILNAQSYLATPAQVTFAATNQAVANRVLNSGGGPLQGLGPLVPSYMRQRLFEIHSNFASVPPGWGVSVRYENAVRLSVDLTTNGVFVDTLFEYGWWALASALALMAGYAWLAGRLLISGPIGIATAGAVLYGFVETWRVFLFSTGGMHFIVLVAMAAAFLGDHRSVTA